MARAFGDEAEIANALYNFFFARRPARDSDEWFELMRDGDTALLDEALEIWTRLGDEHGMGRALWGLSEYYDYRGEAGQGEEAATRALEIFERLGDPFWVSWSRFTRAFGRVMQRRGPPGGDRPRPDAAGVLGEPRPLGRDARRSPGPRPCC